VATTETGPNDASGIVWALRYVFFQFFVFFIYQLTVFVYSGCIYVLQARRGFRQWATRKNGPKRRQTSFGPIGTCFCNINVIFYLFFILFITTTPSAHAHPPHQHQHRHQHQHQHQRHVSRLDYTHHTHIPILGPDDAHRSQRRTTAGNAGQRRPTAPNVGDPHHPTQANVGQRRPT
jgi:hypothetical protein